MRRRVICAPVNTMTLFLLLSCALGHYKTRLTHRERQSPHAVFPHHRCDSLTDRQRLEIGHLRITKKSEHTKWIRSRVTRNCVPRGQPAKEMCPPVDAATQVGAHGHSLRISWPLLSFIPYHCSYRENTSFRNMPQECPFLFSARGTVLGP